MRLKFWVLSMLFGAYLSAGEPKYIRLIDSCTTKFVKELYKEKNLLLCGYGGRMMKDIEQVDLSFDIEMRATINEARKLFVEVAERYLARVNDDEKLRPFLRNFPFTIDNLELGIGFIDQKHHLEKDLAYVSYCKRTGHITYNADNTETNTLYTIYEEPYEEAVRLVKEGGR